MFERTFTKDSAIEKITRTLDSINLRHSLIEKNPSSLFTLCKLYDDQNLCVASGAGKGPNYEIGALAESLEHLVMLEHHDTVTLECRQIRSQAITFTDGLIANIPYSEDAIECIEMHPLDSTDSVHIPAALLSPSNASIENNTPNEKILYLTRYGTNSGSAFGCTQQEAILHGINEAIERHMLSLLFMAQCNHHEQVQLYAPSQFILKAAVGEHQYLGNVASRTQIALIKTTLGPYFSIALPKEYDSKYPLCPIGSGCSIDPVTAVQRGLTELIQTMVAYSNDERSVDLAARELLEHSAFLKPLIELKALRSSNLFKLNVSIPEPQPLQCQIQTLHSRLKTQGYTPLQRLVHKFETNCCVTQIYIPGLERFNLIRSGLPVIPQKILLTSQTHH